MRILPRSSGFRSKLSVEIGGTDIGSGWSSQHLNRNNEMSEEIGVYEDQKNAV
jgi:hypothetical protein